MSAISKNELMINEEIRDREVRLVDETGKALGIVSSKEALKIAEKTWIWSNCTECESASVR